MKTPVNISSRNRVLAILVLGFVFTLGGYAVAAASATGSQSGSATAIGRDHLILPEELAKILQSSAKTRPLVLDVGPRFLYVQAHIPGSEFLGPGSDPQAIQQLRARVKSLPRGSFIVLYCGCCPWSQCPNVGPAYGEMRAMGFTNVKVLYIANNLGTDWVDKGYPTNRGE